MVRYTKTMATETDHHGWKLPELDGDEDRWGEILNNTIEDIDDDVIVKDTRGERPSPGEEDRWYLATDEPSIYHDTGNRWQAVARPVAVKDGLITVTEAAAAINFDTGLDVNHEGNGEVTVANTGGGGGGGGGGGHAVSDDSIEVTAAVADLNIGDDLNVTNHGNGEVTVDSTAAPSISESGSERVSGVGDINVEGGLQVSSVDGRDVTLSLLGSANSHPVSDDGTQIVPLVNGMNFGAGLNVTDDGDGDVTVDANSSGVSVDSDGTTLADPAGTLDFDARFDLTYDSDTSTVSIAPDDSADWTFTRILGPGGDAVYDAANGGIQGGEINGANLAIPSNDYQYFGSSEQYAVRHNDTQNRLEFVRAPGSASGDTTGTGMYLNNFGVHVGYDDDVAPVGSAIQAPNAHLPVTQLDAGEHVEHRIHHGINRSLYLYRWGCQTDNGTTPQRLRVEVRDESGNTLAQANTPDATGRPIYERSSGDTTRLVLFNDTGGQLNAAAHFGYVMR